MSRATGRRQAAGLIRLPEVIMRRLLLAFPVLLSACMAAGAPGARQASGPAPAETAGPAHEAPVPAAAERVYLVLHEVYPSLGLSVARADDRTLTVTSGPVPAGGGTTGAYFRCMADPSLGPTPVRQVSAYVVTSVETDHGTPRVRSRLTAEVIRAGGDGRISRQSCASTGVLEEAILRAVQRRL